MTADNQATNPALEVERVSKTFGPITVLKDVTTSIARGETVALIGENGSGKSTFIKVLSGFYESDGGAVIRMGGLDITKGLDQGPEATGLGFIHQDLALVPNLTILENLRIAQFETGFGGRIKWRKERQAVAKMIERVGLEMSPMTLVGDLSVTERALVAIARGLAQIEAGGSLDAQLLVLDEPTAYLPADGVQRLFGAVRKLAEGGTSILFVSHRLDEVLDHCDRVIVFRGGQLVGDVPTLGKTERDLVTMMLGRSPEDLYPSYNETIGDVVFEVEDLRGGAVESVSFAGRSGEVIGFMGLPGSGYDEIPNLLTGASPCSGGTITLGGKRIDAKALTVQESIANGVVLLPADRKNKSGAQALTLAENVTIATLNEFKKLGFMLDHAKERAAVSAQVERYSVVTPGIAAPLSSLSGGNQQKALLAKWVIADPDVYVLHEPTQGVDVGAKRDVFKHLNSLATAGTLLVICSVEYEDLANLCTRVHIVKKGRIMQTIERENLSAHTLAVAVHER